MPPPYEVGLAKLLFWSPLTPTAVVVPLVMIFANGAAVGPRPPGGVPCPHSGAANGVLAGTYRPISSQDAINRRFNGVLITNLLGLFGTLDE